MERVEVQVGPELAGVNVVLRFTEASVSSVPLQQWLSGMEPEPVWVSLQDGGGVRVMPVLPRAAGYGALLQQVQAQVGLETAVSWLGRLYTVAGVEVDRCPLRVIQVPVESEASLPPTVGRALHGQCFRWLGAADPDLAVGLHGQESMPLTVTLIRAKSGEQWLRLGLLRSDLLAPLLWGMSRDLGGMITGAGGGGGGVRAGGGVNCRLGRFVQVVEARRFEELMAVPVQRELQLRLFTPTSFKLDGYVQPFLLPELVFENLRRRWNGVAPAELAIGPVVWEGLTAAFGLKTRALRMEGGSEIGALGWVRYYFPDEEQARLATILAHFAFFAGVGRKTAMGMGQARLM